MSLTFTCDTVLAVHPESATIPVSRSLLKDPIYPYMVRMTLHFWMVQIAFNIHWSCSIKLCIADGVWGLQPADFIYGTRYDDYVVGLSL